MDYTRLFVLVALTLFVAEGFTLSIFPRQFQQMLVEVDPRALQAAGLVETLLALGLVAVLLVG